MNKIVMCLVFISCSSLFSMDSAITMKFLDEDGNVQAQRQVSADVLKSKSNTLKEMFNDIPVSEVSIPASELPVKVWDEIELLWKQWDVQSSPDEIESLWKLWDVPYSPNENSGKLATKRILAKKTLGEIVYLLNSLEYLQEPNGWLVSPIASSLAEAKYADYVAYQASSSPVLRHLFKTRLTKSEEVNSDSFYDYYPASLSDQAVLDLAQRILTVPSNGYEPALQQLKPRIKELVINSMGRKVKSGDYCYWMSNAYRIRRFMIKHPKKLFIESILKSQSITIPQAAVLVKILQKDELEAYMTEDGRIIDEFKIYKTIDKNIRREVEHYFAPTGCCSCTIL